MKRLFFSVLVSMALVAGPEVGFAQQGHHGQRMGQADTSRIGGMMEGGMMDMMPGMMGMMQGMHQQMMQNPLHRASMMTFMLPAMADTLGLSDQQTQRLEAFNRALMNHRQQTQKNVMAHRSELMGLFEDTEQPDPAAVREHLTAMAELHAEQQAAHYETAMKMQQVLTEEQRQMLADLTPQQRMRQMMTHMPMMDMMRMMQAMHGGMMGSGMMRGMMPMMQGPMMQQGMMNQQ